MHKKRKVEVLPYQESWAKKYREEAVLLSEVFKQELISIHHIGSTSVVGMSAKPIIDILMVVKNIEGVDPFNDTMANHCYEAKGEYGIAGRRFFLKGEDVRTFHVHIYEDGNEEIGRHLNFRDYLVNHPEQAKSYSRLKEKLAVAYPHDIDSYIEGKDGFIKAIDQAAGKWKTEQKD